MLTVLSPNRSTFTFRLRRSARAWLCALPFFLCLPPAAADSFTFGVVPQFEPRKMFGIWQPIIEELERRTGDHFELAVTMTVPEFEREIEVGTFDFIYANPYHVLRVSTTQGYVPLVRDRVPLRGIIVVRKDNAMRGLEELDGKPLAVPSPNALGASLMVRADLAQMFGARVKMVDVKTHSSVYLNVVNGLMEAGGGVEKTLGEQPSEVRDALRIAYTTREMPSHPVAAHPRVSSAAAERVRKALLEMSAAPAGKAMLAAVPMTEPVAASLKDYLAMRQWGLERYWLEGRK